jgi:hypothetical protein
MRNINIFVCFTHKKQNKQKSHSQKPFPGVSDQIGLKGLTNVIFLVEFFWWNFFHYTQNSTPEWNI